MKSKLTVISYLVLFLLLAKGCSTEICGCVQFDTNVNFSFEDETGANLLNPDRADPIIKQDIDLFFDHNGNRVPARSHVNIVHNQTENDYFLQFSPNLESDDPSTIAYLKLGNLPQDTIKVTVREEDDFTRVTKVWYNGEVRWSDEQNGEEILPV